MTETSIYSLVERVARSFEAEKAAGIEAQVQLRITGAQAGDWVVTIRGQELSVAPGVSPDPTLVFGADTQDILDVFNGKLDPMQAYLKGKVKFTGDISTAVRLAGLFHRPQEET